MVQGQFELTSSPSLGTLSGNVFRGGTKCYCWWLLKQFLAIINNWCDNFAKIWVLLGVNNSGFMASLQQQPYSKRYGPPKAL